MDANKKAYPGLYPSAKQDQANQQKIIDFMWKPENLEKSCEEYNKVYDNLWDNHGLDKVAWGRYERAPRLLKETFKSLDYDFLVTQKPKPETLPDENWEHMDMKMASGSQKLEEYKKMGKYDTDEFYNFFSRSHAEKNLLLIAREKAKFMMRNWLAMLKQPDENGFTGSGLPINNFEMEDLLLDVRHEKQKGFWTLPNDKKDEVIADVIKTTWDRMYEAVVKKNAPDRKQEDWENLRKEYFRLFDPKDLSHYQFVEYAKILYLQAFWAGGTKKCEELLPECERLLNHYHESQPNVPELWKVAFKNRPNTPLASEVGLWVKAIDYQYLPRIISRIRRENSYYNFHRSATQVMGEVFEEDLAMRLKWFENYMKDSPNLEDDIQEFRIAVGDQYEDRVDDIQFRQRVIAKQVVALKEEYEAAISIPERPVEETIRDVVMEELWLQDGETDRIAAAEKFIQEFTTFLKSGKGDIAALDAKAKGLLPQNFVSQQNPVTDEQYMQTFVAYINAYRTRCDLWAFKHLMWWSNNNMDEFKIKRVAVHDAMKNNYDDCLYRIVMHQIEKRDLTLFKAILEDYDGICRRARGEVFGTITSAKPLSDAEFEKIVAVMKKQNPGKTFIMTKDVEPSLMSGFIVKCGVDKLDYSLSAELDALKKNY